MDIAFAYLLIAAGAVILGFAIWTWIVVHEAATEAREYFRRQNATGRIEDDETDAVLADWESTP